MTYDCHGAWSLEVAILVTVALGVVLKKFRSSTGMVSGFCSGIGVISRRSWQGLGVVPEQCCSGRTVVLEWSFPEVSESSLLRPIKSVKQ